jgi:hypothetical protein
MAIGLALAASPGVRSVVLAQVPPNPHRIVEWLGQASERKADSAVGKVSIDPTAGMLGCCAMNG